MNIGKAARAIEQALKESGLDYCIENGKNHKKVFLKGRLIGVFSVGRAERRDGRNIIREIEKAKAHA